MELENTREFFDAGLRHYGKALLAVHEFKDLLEEQLQRLMKAQPLESRLTLAKDPLFTVGSGVPPALYFGVFGALAQLVPNPEANTPAARLEVGVMWSPPFPSTTGTALYAGVSGVTWARRIAKPAGFSGGLHRSRPSSYLTRDLEKQDAFDAAVSELLRHLDMACQDQLSA